jgi:hypothetical protein
MYSCLLTTPQHLPALFHYPVRLLHAHCTQAKVSFLTLLFSLASPITTTTTHTYILSNYAAAVPAFRVMGFSFGFFFVRYGTGTCVRGMGAPRYLCIIHPSIIPSRQTLIPLFLCVFLHFDF